MSTPRSVFAQLALVLVLVLLGAAVLALALVRELATRPAAEQLLHALDDYGAALEALVVDRPADQALQRLRALGLDVREQPPASRGFAALPLLRELAAQADDRLKPGRAVHLAQRGEDNSLWLQLDRQPPLWVALPAGPRDGQGVLRFSLWMLLGCVALVWLLAAVFARRLVLPLQRLARGAPGLARGEMATDLPRTAPREVAELAAALERAGADVRAAADERALLLAGISHDIRTPLTRVQFALELLPHTDADLRAGIERDIAEIDGILGQFVAYARDGRDEASERVDLVAICRHAAGASLQPWRLELPDHAALFGKPMALLRAVENLVTNAERHGAAPFVLSLQAAHGAGWTLQVRDHGAGLPPDALSRVLRPFTRGDAARENSDGTGLGLAIVERIAQQHAGTLSLANAADGGLVATLVLRDAS